MAEAKQVDEWNRSSQLAVLIAEPNRDPKQKKEPFDIHDFHPFVPAPPKQRRSAAKLLDKICRYDGIKPSVVTKTTWATPQT